MVCMNEEITTVRLGNIRAALVRIKAKRELETGESATLSDIIREKLLNDSEVQENMRHEDKD